MCYTYTVYKKKNFAIHRPRSTALHMHRPQSVDVHRLQYTALHRLQNVEVHRLQYTALHRLLNVEVYRLQYTALHGPQSVEVHRLQNTALHRLTGDVVHRFCTKAKWAVRVLPRNSYYRRQSPCSFVSRRYAVGASLRAYNQNSGKEGKADNTHCSRDKQTNKQKGSFGITMTRQTEHTTWEKLQCFCCSAQTVTGGRQLNVAACGMRVVELAAGSDVHLTCRLSCYCISFQLHMYTHYRAIT